MQFNFSPAQSCFFHSPKGIDPRTGLHTNLPRSLLPKEMTYDTQSKKANERSKWDLLQTCQHNSTIINWAEETKWKNQKSYKVILQIIPQNSLKRLYFADPNTKEKSRLKLGWWEASIGMWRRKWEGYEEGEFPEMLSIFLQKQRLIGQKGL